MKNQKNTVIGLIVAAMLIIAVGLSQFLGYQSGVPDVSTLEGRSEDTVSDRAMREHCKQMPEMHGCEKYREGNLDEAKTMDHMMMDHSSMVSSEESFVVNMIPHHQEAVTTARLVVARGESAELRKLAQAIITAQEKEIAMMQKWSKDWNYSTVKSSYQNMMGDGTKLSGKALDTWFLQGMIMHHMGAVQMAESLLRLDARKEVSDFAREVIRVQSEEIAQMKLMLGESMMEHRDSH